MSAAPLLLQHSILEPEPAELMLLCPACSAPLGTLGFQSSPLQDTRTCPQCGSWFTCRDGIWRALTPEQTVHFARFMSDYEFIRRAEGRGSASADYYLALPDRDLSCKNRTQWAVRARTFHYLRRKLFPAFAANRDRPLRILDLGAGNCWLSFRLAQMGHYPVAVDLLTNTLDGLGAAQHFRGQMSELFPRVQAEHDRLPFATASFDLVIFNASFHYSENYERTLREAFRCIHLSGAVVIADTPFYAEDASGLAMIEERRRLFQTRFSFPSDSIASLEYLTQRRLDELSAELGVRWQIYKPWYGLRWALRPWLARLHRRREPSRFYLYVAQAA